MDKQCTCGSVDRVEASEAFGRGFESLQVHFLYAGRKHRQTLGNGGLE